MLLELIEGPVDDILTGQVTRLSVGGEVVWLRTSRSRTFPVVMGEVVTVVAARIGRDGMPVALRFWRQVEGHEFRPQLHSSLAIQLAATILLFVRRRFGRGAAQFTRWALAPIACWGFMHLSEQSTFIREHYRTLPRTTAETPVATAPTTTTPRGVRQSDDGRVGMKGSAPSAQAPWWHSELLEYTQDAIIIWEMDGAGILYWNLAAEFLYGYTREEAHGRVTHDLLRTVTRNPVKDVESLLARYGVWVGELRHTAKNGTVVEVEGRLSLMSQRNGRWLVLEVNRDVTDRKHAEATGAARQSSLSTLTRSR